MRPSLANSSAASNSCSTTRPSRRVSLIAPAPTLIAGALAAGAIACGSGERTFSAEEFVEEANENGAGLSLGEPLLAEGEDREVYALRLEGETESPGGEPAGGAAEGHGGGSLRVASDAEAALAEYERCETAVTLLCFRAANIALILEGELPAEDRARIEGALRAMASD